MRDLALGSGVGQGSSSSFRAPTGCKARGSCDDCIRHSLSASAQWRGGGGEQIARPHARETGAPAGESESRSPTHTAEFPSCPQRGRGSSTDWDSTPTPSLTPSSLNSIRSRPPASAPPIARAVPSVRPRPAGHRPHRPGLRGCLLTIHTINISTLAAPRRPLHTVPDTKTNADTPWPAIPLQSTYALN